MAGQGRASGLRAWAARERAAKKGCLLWDFEMPLSKAPEFTCYQSPGLKNKRL